MLRVLTLASLFPDSSRPTFGPFVERQTLGLAAHPKVELRVVAPIGLPPWPLSRHSRYRGFDAVPLVETWKGVEVYRPRFLNLPATNGRFTAAAMARAVTPVLRAVRHDFPFDVIDAEFFFPDGPAAVKLGEMFDVPVSIKARGADIHFWGHNPATSAQVVAAGWAATGLLSVAGALKADMVALGMPEDRIKVHYTGVDLSIFRAGERLAAKAAVGVSGPLVVSVGALIPRKRQALTIESVARLDGVTLALIGKGEDLQMLKDLAERLGMTDRVRFLGVLPHRDIAMWLAAADAMCLPSKSEGLANAWVEALACGTPIAITDVGGARELLDRPEAGYLVEPTVESVAEALADLIKNPRAPSSVRATAERFTWEANRDALYTHLASLTDPESLRQG
jgi:teichuronic acid biosynthesis glycosyltransferase TuaC